MKKTIVIGDLGPVERLELARGTEAAPVGEREAAIAWYKNADWGNECFEDGVVRGFQAGAAYQRAQQPQSAGQEPVGEVQLKTGGGISLLHVDLSQPLPSGTKLYTTPQPSAGVAMPKYKENRTMIDTDESYQDGWNNCLDEFARLNGKEVGRG